MSDYWQRFYASYGPDGLADVDLFRQVGHTVGGQPIALPLFREMVSVAASELQLEASDHLVDFCCGNGLFSYELAARIARLTGIDFVPRNIDIARRVKSRDNTAYIVADVTDLPDSLQMPEPTPRKFLLHYALGYLTPAQLDRLLTKVADWAQGGPFRFFIPGIPDAGAKWVFYNTPERRARHLADLAERPDAADGVGRWWRRDELEAVAVDQGLHVEIARQPQERFPYRMDALFTSAGAAKTLK